MAPHVSWNGVFSDTTNQHDCCAKWPETCDAYGGLPTSCRPPTIQEDSGASDQRIPERRGNAPRTNRNSRDPTIRAASLPLLLPNAKYLQHCDITNQVGDYLHGHARGKCSTTTKGEVSNMNVYYKRVTFQPWM